jgi:hypothetical protein
MGISFLRRRNNLQGIGIRRLPGGRRSSGQIATPPLWIVCWKPSARLCYELRKISGTVFFRLKKEIPMGHI